MTFNSEQEKKEFITDVIDKLAYCPGFKKELEELKAKYQIPEKIKLSHNVLNFEYKDPRLK